MNGRMDRAGWPACGPLERNSQSLSWTKQHGTGKFWRMPTEIIRFVQCKSPADAAEFARSAREFPPETCWFAPVVYGTSGAECRLIACAVPSGAPRRHGPNGPPNGLFAAQLRRVSRETSRALLLLPPSLVRSGTLRSEIYVDLAAVSVNEPAVGHGQRGASRRGAHHD